MNFKNLNKQELINNCILNNINYKNKTKDILVKELIDDRKDRINKSKKNGTDLVLLKTEIGIITNKYTEQLKNKITERKNEMLKDDISHYIAYNMLGISEEEGMKIDLYQNIGRFLYKYTGSLFEEIITLCLEYNNVCGGKEKIDNNLNTSSKTFEIDFLDNNNNAFEIKWRDSTTDGDHIKKEHNRVKCIRNSGLKPIRLMFFKPQRTQAIKIQNKLESLYNELGGEYYSGDDAWKFIKSYTTYDLKDIIKPFLDFTKTYKIS